jgi:hypothetical protein
VLLIPRDCPLTGGFAFFFSATGPDFAGSAVELIFGVAVSAGEIGRAALEVKRIFARPIGCVISAFAPGSGPALLKLLECLFLFNIIDCVGGCSLTGVGGR